MYCINSDYLGLAHKTIPGLFWLLPATHSTILPWASQRNPWSFLNMPSWSPIAHLYICSSLWLEENTPEPPSSHSSGMKSLFSLFPTDLWVFPRYLVFYVTHWKVFSSVHICILARLPSTWGPCLPDMRGPHAWYTVGTHFLFWSKQNNHWCYYFVSNHY